MYIYYIFLGFAPALFWLWYFYRKDKWEPEPKKQVIKIFFLGLVAILPAGMLEYFFQRQVFNISISDMSVSLPLNVVACFLVIGPIEEFFKYSVVKVFIYPRKDFNEKVDGVIYMVAAAMGFSALENVMYICNQGAFDLLKGTYTAIMRGILATPAHAIFSGFLGVYLGKAKFADTTFRAIGLTLVGFAIAIFLHGLYDMLIFTGEPMLAYMVIPLLLISGFVLLKQVHKLVDESPFKP